MLPRMRILRCVLPLAALAACLVLPSAAGAVIVPQRGMLGLRIDMTTTQARARLGPPDAVRRPTNPIFGRYTEYRYGEVRVSFFDSNSRAFSFFTRGRSARTVQGVGVGSTETYLKSALRGETCRTEFGSRHCFFGQFTAGRIVTDFLIRNGRVSAVTVSRVID
jgi:hypothetical protein